MASEYTSRKNLTSSGGEYNRVLGEFRGADFASDPMHVSTERFAHAVNVWRNPDTGAVSTFPGFYRVVDSGYAGSVWGMHLLPRANGTVKALLHIGSVLYAWSNFPERLTVPEEVSLTLPVAAVETQTDGGTVRTFALPMPKHGDTLLSVRAGGAQVPLASCSFSAAGDELILVSSTLTAGERVQVTFYTGRLGAGNVLRSGMAQRKSVSFPVGDKLYILDGTQYLVYDGATGTVSAVSPRVPFLGSIGDTVTGAEERNQLSDLGDFRLTADGVRTAWRFPVPCTAAVSVTADGANLAADAYGFADTDNTLTFSSAPAAGTSIRVRMRLACEIPPSAVTGCRLFAEFDGRVFLSGNPAYPNLIFPSAKGEGTCDPCDFPASLLLSDGVGNEPVTGLIPTGDDLIAVKAGTGAGAVFRHTPSHAGGKVTYPASGGSASAGCVASGAALNLWGEAVFLSSRGLFALPDASALYKSGYVSEPRSDTVTPLMRTDVLEGASVCAWNGYLVVLGSGGRCYLADTQRRYTDENGNKQYEWYYLNGLGVYEGQYPAYVYSEALPARFAGAKVRLCTACGRAEGDCNCADPDVAELPLEVASAVVYSSLGTTVDLRGGLVNPPSALGVETNAPVSAVTAGEGVTPVTVTVTLRDGHAYLIRARGDRIGGTFRPAVSLCTRGDDLWFGCERGCVCRVAKTGDAWCDTFDGRTVFSSVATRMDDCGMPHLCKSTVPRSLVVRTASADVGAFHVAVRTDRNSEKELARINATRFAFDALDFSDLSFGTGEGGFFLVPEREKRWMCKQYILWSDEYKKPLSVSALSYRFTVAGRCRSR